MMVVRSFCFGLNTLSPFGLIAKTETFSPLVLVNKSEGLYQLRVEKQQQRVDDTVKVVEWKPYSLLKTLFPFQSTT
jgi:hypothetical protein